MSDIIQGTEEWLQIRCGKATASRIADVIAKTKSGWGASRANYMAELITERLTGLPTESYKSADMIRGTEKEPEARSAYEWAFKVSVAQVGFVPHPRIAMSGCSPDGLVQDDGLVEFKCPKASTHLETLLGDGTPEGKYFSQVQWQMACTGRKWCDLCSYDDRWPEAMRLHRIKIPRDNEYIRGLETAVTEFLAEIDRRVAELRSRYLQMAA